MKDYNLLTYYVNNYYCTVTLTCENPKCYNSVSSEVSVKMY